MARRKTYTAQELADWMMKVEDVSLESIDLEHAMSNCNHEPFPNAFEQAATLMVASRNLADIALRMMNQVRIQKMDADIQQMRAEMKDGA